MKEKQGRIQFIKKEKNQTIGSKIVRTTSDLMDEAFKDFDVEKRILLEPDYKKEFCNYDSSRVYSESLYLSNFRC